MTNLVNDSATKPLILVLLATCNGQQFIRRQMKSVLSQAGVDLSVIVRDDASFDDTRKIVSAISAQDHRVKLMDNCEASGSAAGNFFRLIIEAKLDGVTHVALCDQDDEWHPDKLLRAVSCLSDTGALGYSSAVRAVWLDGTQRLLAQESVNRRADHLFEGAGQGCTFVIDVVLFRQLQNDLFNNVHLLPVIHYHDWTIYALARSRDARWYFDAKSSMNYQQHAGNDTGARSSISGISRRIKLIKTGWYRTQVNLVAELIHAVRPLHEPILEWRLLHLSRFARFVYVVRHGRRRYADRIILGVAVILGYL